MTTPPTTRAQVLAALEPLLPKRWKFVDARRAVGVLSTVTVLLKQLSIARTPEAPSGARSFEYILTVVDPMVSAGRGEDALDDDVDRLLGAIDNLQLQIRWTRAERVKWSEQYSNAYDIYLTVIKSKGSTP